MNILKKLNKTFLIILFLILTLVVLFLSVGSKSERLAEAKKHQLKKVNAANVMVMPLKKTTLLDKINLAASTKAWEDLNLQSQISGEVLQKRVKKGDFVNEGETIISIDSKKYENVYKSAKATYETAKLQFNRTKNLYDKNIAKKSDLDDLQGLVDQTKAALEISKIDLADCEIKAPIAGFINDIFVEEGELVTVGTPIAQILNTKKIKVKVGIPESDIVKIKKIENFVVEIEALGKKRFPAKKYFLSKATQENIRLYSLELEIDNSEGEIFADMFARVDIIKEKKEKCIALPASAIINQNDKQFVYIEENGKAYKKEIKLGIQEGYLFEAKEGLKDGANLIVMGQSNLEDGQAVKVIKRIEN